MCKRIFRFKLQSSSYWQNINFSFNCFYPVNFVARTWKESFSLLVVVSHKSSSTFTKSTSESNVPFHLKSIHPPYPRGGVYFQKHLPSVWYLDQVYHRGSLFTWNWHSLWRRCFLDRPQGVCGIQMELPNVMQWSKMSLKSVKIQIYFSDQLYTSFVKLPFTTDPTEIGQLVLKICPVDGLQQTTENKEIIYFVCLYLKTSFCKFRLILLNHITNVMIFKIIKALTER